MSQLPDLGPEDFLMVYTVVFIVFFVGVLFIDPAAGCPDTAAFLAADTTDTHDRTPWYTCGHFSRDLAYNASKHNITLGGIILTNDIFGRSKNNHLMVYFIENNTIYTIESETDQILPLTDSLYTRYRLYSDCSQMPSYWGNQKQRTEVI